MYMYMYMYTCHTYMQPTLRAHFILRVSFFSRRRPPMTRRRGFGCVRLCAAPSHGVVQRTRVISRIRNERWHPTSFTHLATTDSAADISALVTHAVQEMTPCFAFAIGTKTTCVNLWFMQGSLNPFFLDLQEWQFCWTLPVNCN